MQVLFLKKYGECGKYAVSVHAPCTKSVHKHERLQAFDHYTHFLPAVIFFKRHILVHILRFVDEDVCHSRNVVRAVSVAAFFHTNAIFART